MSDQVRPKCNLTIEEWLSIRPELVFIDSLSYSIENGFHPQCVKDLRLWPNLQPICVLEVNNTRWVEDGRHRVERAKLDGYQVIFARIYRAK